MNAALTEEIRAGRPVFPVLEVAWASRGYAIGTARYGTGSVMMGDGGPVRGLVPSGGFGPISLGPGMAGNTLVASRTSVKVIDVDGSLATMLETYSPRRSVATIKNASPLLVAADFEPLFTGIVYDWIKTPGMVEILVKTNDAPLASPGPKPIFSRSDWPHAFDPTIYGTVMPFITGIHDSYKVTGRGMVPAVNVRFDIDAGIYWWCASITNLKSIPRIYFDGTPTATGFTILRGTYGGTFQTIIVVDPAAIPLDSDGKPDGALVLSFDCEGPDANGGISGDVLSNPIAQWRTFLNNYVFLDNRTGVWTGVDAAQIGTATWDAAEAYYDLYGYEGAIRLGGGESDKAATVGEDILKSRPWTKAWWNERGQIDLAIIAHADPNVSAGDWINASTKADPKDFGRGPTSREDIKSGVIVPYLYSHSESKYLGSYEAHDISVLPAEERVSVTIEDPFSQGRYSQD